MEECIPEVPVAEFGIRLGGPLPSDLEMLVLKLLAKDPAHRPQSALDVLDLLDRCSVTPWTQAAARTWWATRGTVIWRQTKEPKEPSVDADGREIGDQSTRVFGRQAPAPDGA